MVSAARITPTEFRKALGLFATGVTVITVTKPDGQVHGMTANAFASVSLNPPLVLLCVDQNARTLPLLHQERQFGVSVLAEAQQSAAIYFAQIEQNHEEAERLGLKYKRCKSRTPLLEGALAHLDCRVVNSFVTGDHTIFVAQVEQVEMREGAPLLHFSGQYRRLGETLQSDEEVF